MSTEKETFLLVHGTWHGAWCWGRVARQLRSRGHDVHLVTLTGLGARAHLISEAVTLETHISDVIGLLEMEDLRSVTLVGHSYGGVVISGVADRARDRLARLIFLDALLLEDGESVFSRWMTPEQQAMRLRESRERANGLGIPAPPATAFGIEQASDIEWVNRRVRPQPLGCFQQPLRITRPVGAGLPKTYIACTRSIPVLDRIKSDVQKRDSGWDYMVLDSGHDAMLIDPEAVSELLISIALERRAVA